jgi:hypothetical protein
MYMYMYDRVSSNDIELVLIAAIRDVAVITTGCLFVYRCLSHKHIIRKPKSVELMCMYVPPRSQHHSQHSSLATIVPFCHTASLIAQTLTKSINGRRRLHRPLERPPVDRSTTNAAPLIQPDVRDSWSIRVNNSRHQPKT